MEKKGTNGISVSAEERLALERLARRGTRESLRARAIIGLCDGLSRASVARAIAVAARSVKAWEMRWAAGGIKALVERRRGRAGRRPEVPPKVAESFSAAIPAGEGAILAGAIAGRRGRRAMARLAMEAWVRDAAALGKLQRGAPLPGRKWFRSKFGASPSTVASAMASLEGQGFVSARPRSATTLRERLPFDGKYLLVLSTDTAGPAAEGLDIALRAAAGEAACRARWDVLPGLPVDEAGLSALLADIASHRYAGVFLRAGPRKNPAAARLMAIGRVPIMFFSDVEKAPRNANIAVVDHDGCNGGLDAEAMIFGAIARDGGRRVLVIDAVRRHPGFSRCEYASRRAAALGLEVPDGCYQLLDPAQPEQASLVIGAAVRAAAAEMVDSVAVLQDNFAEAACRSIAAVFGDAAKKLKIVAAGHRPVVHHPCLPVEWHGEDVGASLRTFIDWCESFHSGAQRRIHCQSAFF